VREISPDAFFDGWGYVHLFNYSTGKMTASRQDRAPLQSLEGIGLSETRMRGQRAPTHVVMWPPPLSTGSTDESWRWIDLYLPE
jgi:hypothetical protein